MCGSNPAIAQSYRSIVHPGNTELLESLDAGDNVDQRIHRADLMQLNLVWSTTVDPAFGLTQKTERLDGPLPNPGGERRAVHERNEVSDAAMAMTVRPIMTVALTVIMMGMDDLSGVLLQPSRKHDIDFHGLDSAAIHGLHLDLHLRKPEPLGNGPEPLRGGPSRYEGSQEHVAADPRGRIQNREPCVRHRLRICLLDEAHANLDLALGICSPEVFENAFGLPEGESRDCGQLGYRCRSHPCQTSEAFQQAPALRGAYPGDAQ